MDRRGQQINPGDLFPVAKRLLLLLPGIMVVLLNIVGCLWPGYNTWGFSYWALVGQPVGLVLLLAALVLILPPFDAYTSSLVGQMLTLLPRIPRGAGQYLAGGLGSLLLIILFFKFRSALLLYGDGYMVLDFYKPGSNAVIGGQHWLQPLSVAFYRLMTPLVVQAFGLAPEAALALINGIGGAACLWALIGIVRRLSPDSGHRAFILTVSLTSGAVILFFGYVETYTWALAAALGTVYFVLGYFDGRNSAVPVVVAALVGFSLHMITAPFLLWAVLAVIASGAKLNIVNQVVARPCYGAVGIAIAVSALGLAAYALASGNLLGTENMVIPPIATADNFYGLLSKVHLSDVFNLVILISPMGLFILLLLVFSGRVKAGLRDQKGAFLMGLSLTLFLQSFWLDPNLGMVRDWDLLSFFGFPLTLWAAYSFSRTKNAGLIGKCLLGPAVLVMLVHVAPNLYEKNHLEKSLNRLDGLVWQSPHYQAEYLGAIRAVYWGDLLRSAAKRPDLAVRYFRRRLETDAETPNAWSNLAYIYEGQKQYDSAAACLRTAVGIWPENISYWCRLADVEQKLGNFAYALEIACQAEKQAPNDPQLSAVKGLILFKLDRMAEAETCFRRAYELNPAGPREAKNLAAFYAQIGRYDSASVYWLAAIEVNPGDAALYSSLILSQMALGLEDEAAHALSLLKEIQPDAAGLDFYRAALRKRSESPGGDSVPGALNRR